MWLALGLTGSEKAMMGAGTVAFCCSLLFVSYMYENESSQIWSTALSIIYISSSCLCSPHFATRGMENLFVSPLFVFPASYFLVRWMFRSGKRKGGGDVAP
ncbi:MAG: hypothetical protein U0176_18805 [Bacteroidia bacterium]